MATIRIQDLPADLPEGEAQGVIGGVPNAGTTNTVIIQSGSAAISNSTAAMLASSS
ncbi:MAG: hypothetical protein AB1758_27705 [Candidatus Eremiobacterota bacterium]